jgi:hypothetical protein
VTSTTLSFSTKCLFLLKVMDSYFFKILSIDFIVALNFSKLCPLNLSSF